MRNFFDFTGKKFLVTGASSGIGRSTAIELSRQGAKVVLVARDEARLSETIRKMEGEGHSVFSVDLAKADDLSDLMEAATGDGVRLDGLVHCAGVATILPLNVMTKANMDECMSVNFYSFIELVRQAAKKKFRAEKMSIVATSSISTINPNKCQTIYAASKAALNMAVQILAIELVDKNIRINSVLVGNTDTNMAREATQMKNALQDNIEQKNMRKRALIEVLQPKQIAHAIMYLLSDASSSMTGRILFADGGMIV